jgi:hypothetical protein
VYGVSARWRIGNVMVHEDRHPRFSMHPVRGREGVERG